MFDSPDLELLGNLLDSSGIHWGAEGSRIAGYAIYVSSSCASEIVKMLSKRQSLSPGGLRIFLHSSPLSAGELRPESEQDDWLAWRQECLERDT